MLRLCYQAVLSSGEWPAVDNHLLITRQFQYFDHWSLSFFGTALAPPSCNIMGLVWLVRPSCVNHLSFAVEEILTAIIEEVKVATVHIHYIVQITSDVTPRCIVSQLPLTLEGWCKSHIQSWKCRINIVAKFCSNICWLHRVLASSFWKYKLDSHIRTFLP